LLQQQMTDQSNSGGEAGSNLSMQGLIEVSIDKQKSISQV
jgi:hypothetical protein